MLYVSDAFDLTNAGMEGQATTGGSWLKYLYHL